MDSLEQLARDLGLPTAVVRRIATRVSEGGHEGRYEDLGLIGMGSMGEVRRVRDHTLSRVLAMKIIRPEVLHHPSVRARFIEEAQATAQLEHPAIVPVHEMGYLPDGRVYFTMKQIEGRTLTEVIASHHAGEEAWTLQRLVDVFRRVCEGVTLTRAESCTAISSPTT